MLQQAALQFIEAPAQDTQGAQEERKRLARELHDSVAQLLYGISLQAAAASRSCRAGNTQQAAQRLADIQQDAIQALVEIRLLICELDPPLLEAAGLGVALQACLERVAQRDGLETNLVIDGIERLPPAIERELYRIAVEALSNLVRHARARSVQVHLYQAGNFIYLQIEDDGQGFDPQAGYQSGGLGLHSMQERACRLGGRLEVDSQVGRGSRISARIPRTDKGEDHEPDPRPHRRRPPGGA